MSKQRLLVVALLWSLSLIAVATVVAQEVATQPVLPKVLSGSDVGFRVEGIDQKTGSVIGHVVVSVNGKWVDARIGGGGNPQFTR